MIKPIANTTGSSQSAQILQHLLGGKTITELEGLKLYGCMSVAQRIYDLRRRGHNIQSTVLELPNGKRIAEYRLETTPKQ